MLDKFHCKDCDNYKQCEYYHNRKGTSLICNEFRHKAVPMENIDKMIAEIDNLQFIQTEMEYNGAIKKVISKDDVLEIINKYCKENTDGS